MLFVFAHVKAERDVEATLADQSEMNCTNLMSLVINNPLMQRISFLVAGSRYNNSIVIVLAAD